ncbi:hypothetical protein ABVT39_022479 [Epinephelus coioides]
MDLLMAEKGRTDMIMAEEVKTDPMIAEKVRMELTMPEKVRTDLLMAENVRTDMMMAEKVKTDMMMAEKVKTDPMIAEKVSKFILSLVNEGGDVQLHPEVLGDDGAQEVERLFRINCGVTRHDGGSCVKLVGHLLLANTFPSFPSFVPS